MIGATINSINSIRKEEYVRCIAMHGNTKQCSKNAEFVLFYQIQNRLNVDQFCEDDAYIWSMYLSNYLGVKVTIRYKKLKEKVSFT